MIVAMMADSRDNLSLIRRAPARSRPEVAEAVEAHILEL